MVTKTSSVILSHEGTIIGCVLVNSVASVDEAWIPSSAKVYNGNKIKFWNCDKFCFYKKGFVRRLRIGHC